MGHDVKYGGEVKFKKKPTPELINFINSAVRDKYEFDDKYEYRNYAYFAGLNKNQDGLIAATEEKMYSDYMTNVLNMYAEIIKRDYDNDFVPNTFFIAASEYGFDCEDTCIIMYIKGKFCIIDLFKYVNLISGCFNIDALYEDNLL